VFTWGSLSGDVIGKEASIIVNISEEKFGGVDIYDVRFDFSNLAGGGFGAKAPLLQVALFTILLLYQHQN